MPPIPISVLPSVRPLQLRRLPAFPLVLLVLAACSAGGGGAAPSPAPSPPSPPDAPGSATEPARAGDHRLTPEEFEAIYRARQEAARSRFVQADVDFMTGMIHHHAQAIEMARLAPGNEASPTIGVLAARIINAQVDEIRIMQRWLGDRNLPAPEVDFGSGRMAGEAATGGHGHADHGAHGDHAGHGGHAMPGMISPERMAELAEARGTDFDRLFLTLMIEHHRGAVAMVHELFDSDGAAQDDEVFRFASDVQVDQLTEVARMEQMLSALDAAAGGR